MTKLMSLALSGLSLLVATPANAAQLPAPPQSYLPANNVVDQYVDRLTSTKDMEIKNVLTQDALNAKVSKALKGYVRFRNQWCAWEEKNDTCCKRVYVTPTEKAGGGMYIKIVTTATDCGPDSATLIKTTEDKVIRALMD
jgi:hypothetical protein